MAGTCKEPTFHFNIVSDENVWEYVIYSLTHLCNMRQPDKLSYFGNVDAITYKP